MKKLMVLSGLVILVCAMKNDSNNSFKLKELEKSLMYIPMGNYIFDDSSSEHITEVIDTAHRFGRMISLSAFYMCNHEVTNAEYLYCLNDLKATDSALYRKMLPDTTVWRNKLAWNEPFVKYYLRHPAYANYPMVGITHEQAEYYCKWLTDKYMKEPKRKYQSVTFRLPNVYQWVYAADGGLAIPDFPWGGPYLRGKDGKFLANFTHLPETCIRKEKVYLKDSGGSYHETILDVAVTGEEPVYTDIMKEKSLNLDPSNYYPNTLNVVYDITAPVMSYHPNDYGLYNMAGNVGEYVSEKGFTKGGGWKDFGYYLQNWAEQPYDSASYRSDETGFRVAMMIRK